MEDKQIKTYSAADINKILETFNNVLEDKTGGNGTLFESLYENSVADLEAFNRGELKIAPDAIKPFEEFVKTFGSHYNQDMTPTGSEAYEKLNHFEQETLNQKIRDARKAENELYLHKQFLNAKRFANTKSKKEEASIDDIIFNNRILKQDGLPPEKRKNVDKELEKLRSLAERKMLENLRKLSQEENLDPRTLKESDRLVKEFGKYNGSESSSTARKLEEKLRNLKKQAEDEAKAKQEEQKQGWWKKLGGKLKTGWRKARKWIIAGAIIAGGLMMLKKCDKEEQNLPKSDLKENPAPETTTKPADKDTLRLKADDINKAHDDALKDRLGEENTASPQSGLKENPTLKTPPQSEQENIVRFHADEISKDYYDSALKIHLGEKKRDALYQLIEKRIKEGQLNGEAFTIEHFAHSMVMYKEIQPNNPINKIFEKTLKGEDLSATDLIKIKKAVMVAGEMGDGVKGDQTHSNYEKQSKEAQQKHIQVVSKFKSAKQH